MVSASAWLVVSGASAGGTTRAAAAAPESSSITAAVGADGLPASGPGAWDARRIDAGHYEVSFPHEVALAVRSWEQPAGVTVRPVAVATWLVTFEAEGEPVDTAFTFQAVPTGP